MARGSGRWTELTLDGLNKLMLLVEERLFPGDELAAAMAAAAVAAGGGGDGGGGGGGAAAAGLEASDPAAAAAAAGGGSEAAGHDGKGAAKKKPDLGGLSGMEGRWGEDGTAAGSLTHLVECMLEVRRKKKGFQCPLPSVRARADRPPGRRCPLLPAPYQKLHPEMFGCVLVGLAPRSRCSLPCMPPLLTVSGMGGK